MTGKRMGELLGVRGAHDLRALNADLVAGAAGAVQTTIAESQDAPGARHVGQS
jgi:hypothetical protein